MSSGHCTVETIRPLRLLFAQHQTIPQTPQQRRVPKSSLAERRKVSGRRSVSEVFTRPDSWHVSQHFDPVTQEPFKDLAESDKVQIDFGGGKYETFSKDYLIGMSFHFCLRGTCGFPVITDISLTCTFLDIG